MSNATSQIKTRTAWNKGLVDPYKLSDETRKKISYANSDERSKSWKGSAVSYSGLHHWVRKKLGTPHLCAHCGKTDLRRRQYHWANISGEYKRELTDWIRLCASCHMKYDNHAQKVWAARREHGR